MELDIDEIDDNSPLKIYSSELASQGMYMLFLVEDIINFRKIFNNIPIFI